MPAYRSEAEKEVRDAAVARIRSIRPNARIIHEISNGGSNRFDVVAVSPQEIIAIEVKSEKDTLDLLPAQVEAMRRAAHTVITAMHDCHRLEVPAERAGDYVRDGQHYRRVLPFYVGGLVWVYPENLKDRWLEPRQLVQQVLPPDALHMIWKDELLRICAEAGISANTRTTCSEMRRAIAWNLTGRQITVAICNALRARACIEADPPIEWPKVSGAVAWGGAIA